MKTLLLTLVLIMLVCGCVESTIHFFEEEYYMPGFNLSGNLTSRYITAPPLTPVNSTRIIPVPKQTLVTGYNHSEEGQRYPRGMWITPRGNWSFISCCNYTSQNVRLRIDALSDNFDITRTLFGANVSITNSTNIVIAYANITTNINITNLNGFKLLGDNNALYYINETPVSETVINDTIVFSPLVKEPEYYSEIKVWSNYITPINISDDDVDFHYAKVYSGYKPLNSDKYLAEKIKRINEKYSEGIDVNYTEHTSKASYRGNWTTASCDNIRSITLDYHYANKTWKYFTMLGATCHQIPCNFSGAYCLECEEIRGD